MLTDQVDNRTQKHRMIRVTSPSRLHFGLLSFGHRTGRQFGGAGLMLSEPKCCLQIQPAAAFEVHGESAGRVREFATAWSRYEGLKALPACRINVVTTLPSHVGLGSGTQLALATATALGQFLGRPRKSPQHLASSVGRGLRSAVGTYGFCSGGFICEPGKMPAEALAPCGTRIAIPSEWRFLLIRPGTSTGISGAAEKTAFAELPPVPAATTERLNAELQERMIPALQAADCTSFGSSVYQYGRLAGKCFAVCQGGPFASEQLASIIQHVRSLGVTGVGQSSWGPTLFAILPNLAAAEKLVFQLRNRFGEEVEFLVSAPNNSGAELSVSR